MIFTKKPLVGIFRYKDIFQIFPASLENQPFSKYQEHYPNILEYWIDENEIIDVGEEIEYLRELTNNTAASINKIDKIISLLTTFSNNFFFRYTNTTGLWAFPILYDDAGDEMNSWETKWCLPLYTFNKHSKQMQITNFTASNLPDIERVPHKVFYIFYPDLDNGEHKKIIFPDTMEEMIDAYFETCNDDIDILNQAILHSVNAVELLEHKRTLSMVSSFTVVETLVSMEYKNIEPEQCESCGQKKYSISKKFKDFLLKYVATAETNRKKFNSYYSLRSKILHTGNTLKTEKLFSDVSEAQKSSEYLTRIEVLQIGKLALANWLLLRHRNKMN